MTLNVAVALFLIGFSLGSLPYPPQPRTSIRPTLILWLRGLLFEDRSGLSSRGSLVPRLYELVNPARRKPSRLRDLAFGNARPRGFIDQGVPVHPRGLELLDGPRKFLVEVHGA